MTARRMSSHHRAPLSVGRIAAEAIAVADQEGLEALSMRRLADRLDVEAMADRLAGQLPASPDLPWRESLWVAARGWRDLARQHPGAFPLLATRASAAPALLERGATIITQLRAGGFTPAASAHAFSSFFTSLNGYLLAAGVPAVSRDVPEAAADEATLASASSALGEIPMDAWVLTADAAYEFHVTMLLDGLEAALERGRE